MTSTRRSFASYILAISISLLCAALIIHLFTMPTNASVPPDGVIPVVNVKDYGAMGDGVNDDTTAIQAAIDEALTKSGTVYLPPGNYKVTSQLDVAGNGFITIQGAGGRTLQSTIEANLSSGHVFEVTALQCVRFADIQIINQGTAGRNISFSSGEGHSVSNIRLVNAAGNSSDMLYYVGAYMEIAHSSFVNLEPTAYAIRASAVTGKININTNIVDNNFGGPGKGIIVDAASGTRAEGIKINRNTFILTGAEQITVKTILHIDISHNMLDQGSGAVILLDSQGLGLNGVYIKDNYISAAVDQLEGIGIHIPSRPDGVTNLNISDNMLAYNGYGIKMYGNVSSAIISNNSFTDTNHAGILSAGSRSTTITNNTFQSTSASLVVSDGTTGGPFIMKDNQLVGTNTITKTTPSKFYMADNPGL